MTPRDLKRHVDAGGARQKTTARVGGPGAMTQRREFPHARPRSGQIRESCFSSRRVIQWEKTWADALV